MATKCEAEDDFHVESNVEDLDIACQFVDLLKKAEFGDEHDGLDEKTLERLRNPPTEEFVLDDPHLKLSIKNYLSTRKASQETYDSIRANIIECFPESKMLTFNQVKRKIAEITGVTPIKTDMCLNSCMAYTGPWKDLDSCPTCGETRYDPAQPGKRVPRQQFYTMPIGPQLQANWRSKEGARAMRYRQNRTQELVDMLQQNDFELESWDDVLCGRDYLEAVLDGTISDDDMVLMFSIDGAQLYRMKQSDTWIYIWIIVNYSPDHRYKKVSIRPGSFIPGPNKPGNADSFLFVGLHHLAALQKEGLQIWDALERRKFLSKVFLLLKLADAPGMALISGLVGHVGRVGCRLYCPLAGRHKEGSSRYFPARFVPDHFNVPGCSHPDIPADSIVDGCIETYNTNLRLVKQSNGRTQFEKRRLKTGICRPSLFSALEYALPLPRCLSLDIMHIAALNAPDLILALFCGKIDCDQDDSKCDWDWAVLKGRVWRKHSLEVAACTPFLPGSFDRPPRNPAKKISSRYKAWEYLLYIYGLGPALFYNMLPEKYWQHFCKLVFAIRIFYQRRITKNQLEAAHQAMIEYNDEFEAMYCQRMESRIHFVRPVLHTLLHFGLEVSRIGPGACYSQWTMERTIGNLFEEVKLKSNPFMNLSERGLHQCQVNTMISMVPDLDQEKNPLPRGSVDLGNSYVLL